MYTWKECVFRYCWAKCSKISIRSNWLIVYFKFSISLPIFCLFVLGIFEKVLLKSLIVTVDFSTFPILSVFTSCISKSYYSVHECLGLWCSQDDLTSLSLGNEPSYPWQYFCCCCLKSTSSDINIAPSPAFFCLVLAWCIFFQFFYF